MNLLCVLKKLIENCVICNFTVFYISPAIFFLKKKKNPPTDSLIYYFFLHFNFDNERRKKCNSIISYRTQNSSVVPCIIVSDDLSIKLMAFVCDDLASFEMFPEISEIGKERRKKKIASCNF